MLKYKCSIVACARWEEIYIVEWLNYHRELGFDHVYLYCNDDDPRALYEKIVEFCVGKNPFVTFLHYLYQGQQLEMYKHFLRFHKSETDWICFLDIDEFLRLSEDHTLQRFLSTFESDVDAIYLNWLLFGDSGFEVEPSGGVLLNYTRRERLIGSVMTKTLVRSNVLELNNFTGTAPKHIWHYLNGLSNFEELKVVDVHGCSTL